MGTAHPFLRVAQCSGAGTCSRSRVGGLRRPALQACTQGSSRKRAPARCTLAAALHIGVPWSGGGGSVAGGSRLFFYRVHLAGGGKGVLSPAGWSGHPARPVGGHHPLKTGLGGRGVQPKGWPEPPARPVGSHFPPRSRAHRPGGGRGVQPGGWSGDPARPMGRHYLRRTGRTGLGGTGIPAQGAFRASCKANGGPFSPENRAHQPGGDGESCPGGVRSLLQGLWAAIFLREPGAPARGGRGVLPRGCSEPPARPMGGHLLQRTGRTGLGETGSPAQGVFGASCQAYGGPSLSENRAHRTVGGHGVLPRGCSEPPARPMGGHLCHRTGRTGLGGTGSPAQGVFGASCQANGGPPPSENRAHRPGGDRESCPGGVRSLLQGLWGAIFVREPGAPARGGRGVLPRGCSEPPARPMGGYLCQRTGRTGLGGTGIPAQGVFGASCKAYGGLSLSENRAHRPGGDRDPSPGGVRSLLQGLWGAIFVREPGAPAWGGQGVLPRGRSEPPARPMGGHLLQRTGRTGLGGTGSHAQGVFGASCKAYGGPSLSENRAHRPGGDRDPSPGGVRSLLQGLWGAIFVTDPGAPAWGGQGVLPRGCSEPPARPMGGYLCQRTGRTGLGGTGIPAQGVFGASCKAYGGPSLSENRAHRPGGDRESCPGGVRSLLPGQWGAIFVREPGAPAWGGQGVLPRGCSEPPARPMGGYLCQRTGRTGLGGTGSPAQGVFGASCRTRGYSLLPLSSSRQVSRQYRGS